MKTLPPGKRVGHIDPQVDVDVLLKGDEGHVIVFVTHSRMTVAVRS